MTTSHKNDGPRTGWVPDTKRHCSGGSRSGQVMGRRDGWRRGMGAGAHAGWGGVGVSQLPAPATAHVTPPPNPAQSMAGIGAAIPNPSVTLA